MAGRIQIGLVAGRILSEYNRQNSGGFIGRIVSDTHFCRSPVIDQSNPQKSDRNDPYQDIYPIRVQCRCFCVLLILLSYGHVKYVPGIPDLFDSSVLPYPAADQKVSVITKMM